MSKKIVGVYEIRNTINNKVYIGCSGNIKLRWRTHRTKLRGGRHENTYLQRSFDKHGEDVFVFSVIEETNVDSLITVEQKWLDLYKSYERDKGYNLAQVGTRRTVHYTCTVEGCGEKHLSGGLCNKHYRRMRRHGTVDLPEGVSERLAGRGCKVEGCTNQHDSLGYCAVHAYYIRKYGQIQEPKVVHDGTQGCVVEGCDKPHASNGFCHGHHERHRYRVKHGIPEDYKMSVREINQRKKVTTQSEVALQ